jgi:hypothetical protein
LLYGMNIIASAATALAKCTFSQRLGIACRA